MNVFVRQGTVRQQQAKLSAHDPERRAAVGVSVAIFENTVVAGAPGSFPGIHVLSGAAYVFFRQGTQWQEQAKLVGSDTAKEDFLGGAVSIFGDTVAIGAPHADPEGVNRAGAVYMFGRQGTA